ncbi:MAG: cytochrome c maturation protein CcmE [Rhodospirillaceae bacterium]|nr:cytochrome c maturation protein CcmE [Rhodospirillaceae bacterium]MCY4311932.1 cytochrome c maturation protein CcmE [Rhodospirillaceae bacterium]
MRPKRRRMAFLGLGLVLLATAVGLVLAALGDGVTFFFTPSKVAEKKVPAGQQFRLGGLVAQGSRKMLKDGLTVSFRVTDCIKSLPVVYTGVLPDLFREGQGVVAIGRLEPSGVFRAETVLAKHDENYMPKDLADQLKEQGKWHEDGGGKPCPETET